MTGPANGRRLELGPWLRPSQAAPLLGLDVGTVRSMCAEGEISCRVTGSPDAPRYKIPEAVIREYNANSIRPAKEPRRRRTPRKAAA